VRTPFILSEQTLTRPEAFVKEVEMTMHTTEKPVLIVIEGTMAGQQWVMHKDSLTIGRGGDCDIVLAERPVSREHLRIWRDEQGYWVEDLESKNGTFLNGEPINSPTLISEGDELQIALCVKMRFIGAEATVPLTLDDDLKRDDIGLHLDPHTRETTIKGEELVPPLSLHQYRLLELLVERDGGVCTRDEVVEAVWPDTMGEGVSEQAIDALVRRLRDRLVELDPDHQYVITVRGHGFRFQDRER
jgi:hypothetical protein